MDINSKAFELFWRFYNEDEKFRECIKTNLENGKIRFFGDEEWEKISSQNFISPVPEMKEFMDMFTLGYNIGNCGGASRQLSFSYDDVDIISGRLPLLKGTLNAEKEGGHVWLERKGQIIDTSLMLVIDKSLKNEIGYIEEQRLTSYDLAGMPMYQARKEFVNDKNLRKPTRK